MRVIAAVFGLLLVAGVAALLWPRLTRAVAPAGSQIGRDTVTHEGIGPKTAGGDPTPAHPLEPPLTHEEEIRQDFARKRIPFFRTLRESHSDVIRSFGVPETLETLDLVVSHSDDATLGHILSEIVGPSAREYGFSHVRFYAPNPPGSVSPTTLVAESTRDETGRWNTFRK